MHYKVILWGKSLVKKLSSNALKIPHKKLHRIKADIYKNNDIFIDHEHIEKQDGKWRGFLSR